MITPRKTPGELRVRWLSDLPSTWEVVPSKWLFSLSTQRALPDDEQLTASQDDGVILQAEFMRRAGRQVVQVLLNREILKHVEPDDFVISMRSFQGGLERSWARGCISSAYVVLKPGPEVHVPFYAHVFKSTAYIQALQATSNLVRDGQALRYDNFSMVYLPRLPLDEQRAIADFLDRKTAAIDDLIAKKERLLALLAEKRAAQIHRAVTKGLDPSVPMKDSGVPWIGDIPSHWRIKRLKHLIEDSAAGPYGSSLTKAMYTKSGFRVYGQQQVIPDDFSRGDYFIPQEKFDAMQRYEVHPGDLLVSVMGTVGKVAVVPEGIERGIINPRLVRYKLVDTQVMPRFAQLFIQSEGGQAPLLEAAQGSTMDGLNMTILGELRLVLPPLHEQQQINAQARAVAHRCDDIGGKLRDQIDRLKEYRQAAITAAVTGQVDVTARRGTVPSHVSQAEQLPIFGVPQ